MVVTSQYMVVNRKQSPRNALTTDTINHAE